VESEEQTQVDTAFDRAGISSGKFQTLSDDGGENQSGHEKGWSYDPAGSTLTNNRQAQKV
jgi:hypothetical protein